METEHFFLNFNCEIKVNLEITSWKLEFVEISLFKETSNSLVKPLQYFPGLLNLHTVSAQIERHS